MHKHLLLTTALLGFSTLSVFAQVPEGAGPNLVPNPSFEDRKTGVALPKEDLDGSASFRQAIAEWNSPSLGTPDWLIVPKNKVQEAKKQGASFNEARTGIKMVAILTYHPKSERSAQYREYIQVKLSEPTKKGQEYYFEFWVCQDHRSKIATNNLGLVLSPSPVHRSTEVTKYEPISDIKPDYNHKPLMNADKREWVRISGTFKSANRSLYLLIGNFFDNKGTQTQTLDRGDQEQGYYLIDDVALHEVNPKPDPVPEPEPVKLAEKPIEVGTVIELDHVYFETAKWKLLPESSAQLDELVELMNKYPLMEIEIAGHTDDRGSDKDNQKLSENRTKSVYEYLVGKSIPKERMKYTGYGEAKPKADNGTPEGRSQNRRVEFVVTKTGDDKTEIRMRNETKNYNGGDK
jgi:OmpA-OmpF porin, OOP family